MRRGQAAASKLECPNQALMTSPGCNASPDPSETKRLGDLLDRGYSLVVGAWSLVIHRHPLVNMPRPDYYCRFRFR